ncbi:hypothetical protein ACHQM5_008327 [Ranunculus cassubicifolius]
MVETPLTAACEGEILSIEVHYGGILLQSGRGGYINGSTLSQFFRWDNDLNYDVVAQSINKDVDNVAQLFYKIHDYGPFKNSRRVLACQQDLKEMLEAVSGRILKSNLVEIYVQHIDGYESDTASLDHLSDSDEELCDVRMKRLEARVKKNDTNLQVEGVEGPPIQEDYNEEVSQGDGYEGPPCEEDYHELPDQQQIAWITYRDGDEEQVQQNGWDQSPAFTQPLNYNDGCIGYT